MRAVAVAALTLACSLSAQRVEAQARQGLLSLDDARLFYEVVGSGPPMIVIHGGPGLDHSYLRPGLDALARERTLVYYDQRGTGRSTAELTPDVIDFDAFVSDVEAIREALGYEQVDVLAHSFGALIGLEYAARYPSTLRSLILMTPVEPGSRFMEDQTRRQSAARTEEDSTELARLMASEGFAARDAATLSQVFRITFRQALRDRSRIDELDLDLAETTARNGQDVGRLLGESLGGEIDLWDRISEIEVPTLVLHGRYDLIPPGMSQELAETLPQGRLAVLEAGHFPYVEDPAGLFSTVSAFFVDLSR